MLFLFDIDGTLLNTGGLSRQILDQVIEKHTGDSPNLDYSDVAGFTDPAIIRTSLRKLGFEDQILSKYHWLIMDEYPKALEKQFSYSDLPHLYDDAANLLVKIIENKHCIGLITGNLKSCAETKLKQFGIWDAFPFGVFGDDTDLKSDMPWLTRERAWEVYGESFRYDQIVIVGDTVQDCLAAKEYGCKSIIVCRNFDYREKIRNANPDYLVDNLGEIDITTY